MPQLELTKCVEIDLRKFRRLQVCVTQNFPPKDDTTARKHGSMDPTRIAVRTVDTISPRVPGSTDGNTYRALPHAIRVIN